MSTDYVFSLDCGFVFEKDDVLEKFVQTEPAKYRLQDRWDPNTGKKLAPVKIPIEEEFDYYVLNGKEFETDSDFLDALCKKIAPSCQWEIFESAASGTEYIVFKPQVKGYKSDYNYDAGHISAEGAISIKSLQALLPKFMLIKKGLKKFGFDTEEPMVFINHSVG